MNCIHLFPVYPEIFPVFSYDKSSQHSKWMDNLKVDWSSGWILSGFFGCEGKIHKLKPCINQACKEIHTTTLGMKLTTVVCKLEIKINLSKSKVKLHPYSKSISTAKCVISPLFKINMYHQMWNVAPTKKSICTSCQDLNQGPSAYKLSVQTTTPPVLDTIFIEQQAIILPR